MNCTHDDDTICPCVLALYFIGADVRCLTEKRKVSKETIKWYKANRHKGSYRAGYEYVYGPSQLSLFEVTR